MAKKTYNVKINLSFDAELKVNARSMDQTDMIVRKHVNHILSGKTNPSPFTTNQISDWNITIQPKKFVRKITLEKT